MNGRKSIKPTKNRFFCYDCGKIKMLFQSEKEADSFMKFNSEDIEEETGQKLERLYYCIACGGWHLTSQKEFLNVKSRTERVIEQFELTKDTKKIQKKINEIKANEEITLLDAFEKKIIIFEKNVSKENDIETSTLLDNLFSELEIISSKVEKFQNRVAGIEKHLRRIKHKIEISHKKSKAKAGLCALMTEKVEYEERIKEIMKSIEVNALIAEVKLGEGFYKFLDEATENLKSLNQILIEYRTMAKERYPEVKSPPALKMNAKRKRNIENLLNALKSEIEEEVEMKEEVVRFESFKKRIAELEKKIDPKNILDSIAIYNDISSEFEIMKNEIKGLTRQKKEISERLDAIGKKIRDPKQKIKKAYSLKINAEKKRFEDRIRCIFNFTEYNIRLAEKLKGSGIQGFIDDAIRDLEAVNQIFIEYETMLKNNYPEVENPPLLKMSIKRKERIEGNLNKLINKAKKQI